MKLSIIIPVFNEEKTITKIVEKIYRLNLNGVDKEIIIVNDGSTDGTTVAIQKITKRYRNIKIITHEQNMGKGAGVRSGIKAATGDFVIIQDADLEYDPKDIVNLLRAMSSQKAKIIYGTRLKRLPDFSRDERTWQFFLHYLGNKMLSLLTSILYGQWITDMETGYKLMSRDVIKDIPLAAKGFEFEPEITAKLIKRGYKIVELPISTNPRGYQDGKKLNTVTDGVMALWTIIKYRFTD